jgi:hypothetical protein
MLALLFFLFQESDRLGWFSDNHDAEGWDSTTQSWLISGIVIAVVCAGLMLCYKWLKKRAAETIEKKIWSRGQSVILMLVGLFPVLLFMLILWYTNRDYFDVVGVGGLMKGILLGWIVCLLCMFIGHLAGPWRREIL